VEYLLLLILAAAIGVYLLKSSKADGSASHRNHSAVNGASPRASTRSKDSVEELPLSIQERNEKNWRIEFYGGDEFDELTGEKVDRVDGKGGQWEGYLKYFRKYICDSQKIVPEDQVVEVHLNYSDIIHKITGVESKLVELNDKKRFIKKTFLKELKELHFDNEARKWSLLDISGAFLRTRAHMINRSNPIPAYAWNTVAGNPFGSVYAICRDYVKYTGKLTDAKKLFENCVKWESGSIFKPDESLSRYEDPLWVDWNVIGKNLLALRAKLKKDSTDAEVWLRDVVGSYIAERQVYYSQFGESAEHFIDPGLVQRFTDL
jgi:hypothetical protein